MPVLSFLVGVYASLCPNLHPTHERSFVRWIVEPAPDSVVIQHSYTGSAPLRVMGGFAFFEFTASPNDMAQLIERLELAGGDFTEVPDYGGDPPWWNQTAFNDRSQIYLNSFHEGRGRFSGEFDFRMWLSPERDHALVFVIAEPRL
ncbi:MAG: hypothetical protein AAGA57_07975 [Planctomycetota bacterium]